jgi:superfamily I DNA/RNA helicase
MSWWWGTIRIDLRVPRGDVQEHHGVSTAFPGTQIYKLEENYRSTQPILNLANCIIDEAAEKYTKRLFTRKIDGPLPSLVEAAGENTQSRFIAQKILELREEGVPLSEVAVLFRSSFHSFDLEIELSRKGLPFIKRGGVKFIETAHVKDLLRMCESRTAGYGQLESGADVGGGGRAEKSA